MDLFIFMYLQPFSKCGICQIGEYRTKTIWEILLVNLIGTKKNSSKKCESVATKLVYVYAKMQLMLLLNYKWNQVEASMKSKHNGRLIGHKWLTRQHVQSG